MTDFRSLSQDAGARRVRAQVADAAGKNFYPFTFAVAAVEGVMGLGEKASALVLRSGVKIAVALPYAELEQKIYAAADFRAEDGDVLDLTAVTGPAAQKIVAPELARDFNKEAGLKIRAFLRRESSNEFVAHEFFERDIVSVEPDDTSRSKCGYTLTVTFNDKAPGPFGSRANLDMPQEDFIDQLATAKENRRQLLDLCALFRDNPDSYGLDI